MKTKNIYVLIAAALFLGLMSCNNSGEQKHDGEHHEQGDTIGHSDAEHHHVYTCPMHPDVISDKPGTCPKCGMALVHHDPKETKKEYFMHFTTTPARTEPGKAVLLSFIPKVKGSESEAVPLDVVHEKKIHLIVVSDDLSHFDHIHPEYQADGSYNVAHTFTASGNYFLFADYQPTGGNHTVDKLPLTVEGTPAPAKKFTSQNLTASSGNYSVTLEPAGGRFITNVLMHISGIVKKNGKEINGNTLENYLGEKAHVVMISMDDKIYMHVHPSVGASGRFDLHTTFEKPGIYRWWFQFQAEGKVYTLDYVLSVAQSTQKEIDEMNEAHSQHHLEEQEKAEHEEHEHEEHEH